MKKAILALAMLVLGSSAVFAQEHTVTGKVTAADGTPLPGITIQIKGSNTGTATNTQGIYEIPVPDNGTLIFRGVGLQEKSVQPGAAQTLNVIMLSSTSELNELVVTALGIQRTRNSLPYAAQQISGSDVNKTVTTNVVQNLSGKIAGLQITSSNAMGGSNNAILRGMKSLTQSNQALFVIDGVPFDNTNLSQYGYDVGNAASDINPDDIASISVLKGAAASALYGSRASNGVILITTKKGRHNQGVGVSASFGVTVGSFDKSTLPVYQTQYGEGYGSIGSSDPGNPNFFFFYQPIPSSNGKAVPIVQTNVDAGTGPAYNPSQQVYNWDAFSPGNPNYGKPTPWQPAAHHEPTDFFVTPVTTTESVFAQGGGSQGTFKIGYTRSDDKGYLPNSSITKNSLDLGATYNVTDRITVGGSLNYTKEDAINRYLYQYTATTSPMTDFRQWWPTNVDLHALKNDYFRTLTNASWNWQDDGSYQTNVPGNIGTAAYHDNPYWVMYQNYEADGRNRYFGNANVNYKITDYLNLMGRVSLDNYDQLMQQRSNIGSVELPMYERYDRKYSETNYDLLLNFNKDIGANLNLKALLGGNVRRDEIQSIDQLTSGGLVVPGFWSLSNSKQAMNAPVEELDRKEVDGVFAGATLSYKQMLTLDATIRRDASSTLPKGNNSYYYPSVSANFVFSKLLPTATWLSYGKIWGNFAQVGGDAPYYSLQNIYTIGTPFNGQSVASYAQPASDNTHRINNNPNLVPETNKSYEVGLESSFLNNRIGVTVDYYNSRQSNQIMPINVSRASGFTTFFVNGGTVQNQGVELTLDLIPVKTPDFSWEMNLNWSANRNKVISLYGGQPSYAIAGLQNTIQIVAEVGQPYGVIRGTDYVYKNGQRVIDNTGHYEISDNQLSDIGNINPDWIGGMTNTFTYKNLALSFLLDVQQGGQVYSLDMDYGSSSGLYPRTAGLNDLGKPVRAPLEQGGGIILKGVTEDGKPNSVRIDESDINNGDYSFSSAYGEADKEFVYNASYVKLRQVALTYSLPPKTLDRLGFVKGLDLSLAGRNLWIIHKDLPYADPEQGQASGTGSGTGSGSANGSMGFQNGAYPSIRTFDFIVKVTF